VCVVQVSRAVEWLCTRSPSQPPDIESHSLVDYVENSLTTHFYTPVLQDLAQRQKLGAAHAVSLAQFFPQLHFSFSILTAILQVDLG